MENSQSMPSLEALAQQGVVPPADFTTCPERVVEIASIPLLIPDLSTAKPHIMAQGHYEEDRVEDALIATALGHVILARPPGTGKTKLAGLLADAYNVILRRETANPEWSVYDVVGSQTLNAHGGTQAKHGIVTSSILDCAATTVQHLDRGQGPQAQWLLIDEMNRAEIDRAFGPLFTAISGEEEGTYSLDYMEVTSKITIPRRFRILCTMNDYDTRFVNSMSGALRRRFGRVLVLPPENTDGMVPEREISIAIEAAKKTITSRLGGDVDSYHAAVREQATLLRRIFGGIRHLEGHEGIAVGTSHLIDCCTFAMAYLAVTPKPDSELAWYVLFDRVLETRLVSALETDSTRIRLTDEYVAAFDNAFPALIRTKTRLRKFLHGSL